ncbi:MAG: hypothetical protein ACTSUB_07390 [Candidatus Thorarchaeota archaeon]
MKLVELATLSIAILKRCGSEGIRSDLLAEELGVPKRRVYDVIAVLTSLDHVETKRRFNGTTVVWIDRTHEFVSITDYSDIKDQLNVERESRKTLQLQVVEVKEQLRRTKSKMRMDVQPIECANKTEFPTSQIRIRSISSRGFKKVADSGHEVIIETYEPGMVVDPTEKESDRNEALLKSLQRI